QIFERSHWDGDREGSGFPSSPHNACLHRRGLSTMQHHFVDQAAQKGFSLLLRKQLMVPECWQMLANRLESRLKLLTQREQRGYRLVLLCLGFLIPFECRESLIPSLLQGGSDQAIIRINTQKLAFGKLCLVTQALQVLRVGMRDLVDGFLLAGHRATVDIQFNGRECLEKRFDDMRINCVAGNMLADGYMIFLAEKIAEITGAALVLHNHLVPTLSTVDQPVQQRSSWSRHASGFVPVVLSI